MSLLEKNLYIIFVGNIMFDSEDVPQAYLVFQPVYRYFKTVTNTNYILSRKSKGLSAESIKPLTHLIIVLLQN